MNIELTREQLMTLIECAHFASHIRDSNEVAEIENLLLGCAEKDGLDGLVMREEKGLALNRLIIKSLHDEIDIYESDVFWSSLAEELAERDLRIVRSEEEISALSDEQFDAIIEGQACRYDAEFAAHGSTHLSLAHELPVA
jgi:hypothetical protein